MIPDTSQWRSSPTYDYVDSIGAPDLAWEWLRRNERYQRDYRGYAEARTPQHQDRTVTDWPSCWGLRFPGQARSQRSRHAGLLGTPGPHLRRIADRHPSCLA
jgi:hypothetical protein